MSTFTEFFIARPRDVKARDWDKDVPSRWLPAIALTGFSYDVLELKAILTKVPLEKLEKRDAKLGPEYRVEVRDGERCVRVFSEKFVAALASLKPKDLRKVTKKWIGEELDDEEWPLLGDLVALSRVALGSRGFAKPNPLDAWRVYLWGSL